MKKIDAHAHIGHIGGWADVGSRLRWPYRSIPEDYVPQVRKRAHDIIPEFV